MKTLKLPLGLLFFLLMSMQGFAIGNGKTLMVEYFGTNIFRIDEENNIVFERENDLLQYAVDHNFDNLILKRVDEVKYGNSNLILFPKWARASTYTPTGSAKAKEDSLAKFLYKARTQFNIAHIAVTDKPYDDTTDISNNKIYKRNFFFYNIHQFNVRQYAAHSNNNDYCFDMLYGEDDFWTGSGAAGSAYDDNWSLYYLPGLREIDSVKTLSSTTTYGTLLTGTYIGNLTKVTGLAPSITIQMQVDSIDRHTDWDFLDLYFRGFKIDQLHASDTTYEFFHRDKILGERIKRFARNAYPSVVLPLFASQASADTVNSDFFGDNLLNANGLFFSQDKTDWHGTITDVKSFFENIYNTVQDPYHDHISGQGGLTMKELAEDSVPGGNVANNSTEGVGWFKYGTMPDNNVYLLKADTVGIDTSTTFTLKPDQLVTNGMDSCIKCRSFNYNASSNAQIIAKNWYEDGILMSGANDSTLTVNLLAGDTIVYTYEITVETPGSGGAFNKLKLRSDMKVIKSVVVGSGSGPYWKVANSVNPTCPNFNNGTVTVDYFNSSCSSINKVFKWYNASNTLVLTQNSTTATGLSAGKYRVELWCGTSYFVSQCYVILHAVDNRPHPTIYSSNDDQLSCYGALHINSAYSTYSRQWYRNGTASVNAISGATALSYTATQGGTYYIKVTPTGGCPGFSAPFVINYSPTPVITGSNITCDTNKTYTVPFDTNNATYAWTVPSGVSKTQDANSITILSWGSLGSAGGTISCTVTNACGHSASASFVVKGCCSAGTGDLNNAILNTTQTRSGTFHINGTLRVTGGATVNFSAADIKLNENAKIIVDAGCTLLISGGSHLRTCDTKMWKGIVLPTSSSSLEVTGGSIIEDADTAINVEDNGTVYINHSTLNANYCHLRINGNSGTNGSYIGSGSVFSCKNGSGVNANCLKSPHTSQRTSVALNISNCSPVTIGDASNAANSISNCDRGIYTTNSTIDVLKSDFSTSGQGIYAYSDGTLTVDNCNFDLCTYGIEDRYQVNITATNNHFTHGIKGIFTSLGNTINIFIHDNYFFDISVFAIQNISNHKCLYDIYNNSIYSSGSESMYYPGGIEINGLLDGNPDNASITDIYQNEFYNLAKGIHLQSIDDAHIFTNLHNELMATGSYDYQTYGIKVENCNNSTIENNSVTSYGSSLQRTWWSNGIMADNSPYTEMLCNSVGNIGRGLWVGGASPHTTLAGNAMGDCYDQVYLNWNLMGLQDQGGSTSSNPPDGLALDNEWVGSPYTAGNGHQTTSHFSNYNKGGGYTTFHTRSGSPFEPTDNYTDDITGTYFACTTDVLYSFKGDPYCTERPRLPDDKREEERIAKDSIDYGSSFETFKWMSKEYLLDRSKKDATLAANNIDIANAVAQLSQENVGVINALKDSIKNIELDSASLTEVLQLQQINNGLQPVLAVESNYKTANNLSLILAKNKQFTNGQKSSIIYLSTLCPYAAGPAVYMARTLRALFDTIPPRYIACDTYNPIPANRKSIAVDAEKQKSFHLYPSPSDGSAVYDFTVDAKTKAEIKIFDYTGKLIANENVSGKNRYEFKKLNLSEGVYRVLIFSNNQLQDEQNMVVVK